MTMSTVGKREVARYDQFLLFPLCFRKPSTADTLKPGGLFRKGVTNPVPNNIVFSQNRGMRLMKTVWKNEKMLVSSIFSFFHTVFIYLWTGNLSSFLATL